MRFELFSAGRYGLHGITGDFKGTVSAWYDHRGVMFDAEQILEPFGRVRPLKGLRLDRENLEGSRSSAANDIDYLNRQGESA